MTCRGMDTPTLSNLMSPTHNSTLIDTSYIDALSCTFSIYLLPSPSPTDIQLYVAISYEKEYEGIPHIDKISLEILEEDYNYLLDTNQLIDFLTNEFLDQHLVARGFDVTIH